MTKRLAEGLILSGCILLAVLLYRSAASFPTWVQGSTAMYVRFLGASLGILCVLELFLWFRKKSQSTGEKMIIATEPVKFWGLFALLIVYAFVLSPLGFYLSSALFLPIGMLLLGARSPLSIGLTSGGVLLFIHLVFVKLLEVHLPKSTLF